MKRFAIGLIAAALLTPATFAHEIEAPSTPQLPSAADIAQMQANMPDLNVMMRGMMDLMQDPEIQGSLKSAGEALSGSMEGTDFSAKTEDGMPDFNALMGAMFSVMGDESVTGPLMDSLKPMQEAMPKLLEDAMPKDSAPKDSSPE